MSNPCLLPQTRTSLIDRHQTSRPPTDKQVADAYFQARLHYVATARNNPEAQEQIRILQRVTNAAQDFYFQAVTP